MVGLADDLVFEFGVSVDQFADETRPGSAGAMKLLQIYRRSPGFHVHHDSTRTKGPRHLIASRKRIASDLGRHPVKGRDPGMTNVAPRSVDPGLRRGDDVGRCRFEGAREQAAPFSL